MVLIVAIGRHHLQDAAGNVDRRRIEHGVVIGEGHVLKHHAVVVLVERSPAAVLALHGEDPVDGALDGLALVATVGMLDAAQRKANHCAIIHIRVKLVVKLEVPSARLALLVLDLPVAGIANLLLQNPVGALHHARIVRGHSRFAQGEHGIGGIPHGRHARLHAERVAFLDAQLFELIEGADHLRIVERISLAAQGNDGVHHRGIDGAQTVAHLEALEHPLLALASARSNAAGECGRAQTSASGDRGRGRNCARRPASSTSAGACGTSACRRRIILRRPSRGESS